MSDFNEQYQQLDPRMQELIELHNTDEAIDLAELASAEELQALPVELRERVSAFDEAIVAAMFNVAVPEGLDVLILDRIQKESTATPKVAASAPTPLTATPLTETPLAESVVKPNRRHTRRWALLTAVSVLALVGVGWVFQQITPPEVAPSLRLADAPEAAVHQFDMESDLAYSGLLVMSSESAPLETEGGPTPESHPISHRVFASPRATWRQVENLLGRSAIAYDLTDQDSGFRATLYVLDAEGATGSTPPKTPPPLPDLQTRNRSCSVWLADNRLYVLVVQGDAQRYQRMLDMPTGPLT